MNQKDYYKILGVNTDAGPDEIKKAYRNLAFRHHPDRSTGSEEMMKEINEAYAVLSNPVKRKEYDNLRQMYGSYARDQFRQTYTDQDIFQGSDISQIFEEFSRVFGFNKPENIFSGTKFYGRNYQTFDFRGPGRSTRGIFFYIPLKTVYQQRVKKYPYQAHQDIRAGRPLSSKFIAGAQSLLQKIVAKKLGLELPENGRALYGVIKINKDDALNGGKVSYSHGRAGNSRNLLISIPPGVRDGQKIKLQGLGGEGRNGGEPGDLYLKVVISEAFLDKIISFAKGTLNVFNFRVLMSILCNLIIFGGLLFLTAGTLAWWRAWVFTGMVFIGTVATMLGVFPGREELLNERFKLPIQRGQPLADKIILLMLIITFICLIIFIPMDVFRFHMMSKPATDISSLGLILFIAGWWLISLSFKENPFAAPVVKRQEDRHQKVIDTGVYRIVRHPMYAGGILLMLGMPLWLESYAATLLAVVPIGMIIFRILVEEQFLRRALPGYDAYMKRVRYRIIPFLW